MRNEIGIRYTRFAEYVVQRTMDLPFTIMGIVEIVFQWAVFCGLLVAAIVWLEPDPRFEVELFSQPIVWEKPRPPFELGVFTRPLQLLAAEALLACLRSIWRQFCPLLDARE